MTKLVKVCPVCKKEFISSRRSQKFCCFECMRKSFTKDITGKVFGKWKVLKFAFRRGNHGYYLCECECGNKREVSYSNLITGKTLSCGCLSYNRNDCLSRSKIYKVYHSMINRCTLKKYVNYKNYGGRGIKVCQEWLDNFMNFYNWAMANGYEDGLSIDRINVNGDYCPENCRWVTVKKQANNKRNNHYITYNGETHTLSEWATIKNISYGTLSRRINRCNWSIERALTTPVKHHIKDIH